MPPSKQDAGWLAAAAVLALRARPLSRPNPAVGAILVKGGIVIGQGWTQPGGRPHAEAVALAQAGAQASGATLYVTLEPCAHESPRGPCCTQLTIAAGVARVVIGVEDPDPRTAGDGIARLKAAGIAVELADDPACHASLAGYLMRKRHGRPFVTLKLALTADGLIAREDGTSKWITGPEARAHAHLERAMSDAILVGGGTLRADAPRLDVRLPGLEQRSPRRYVLTRGAAPEGWHHLASPQAIADPATDLTDVQYLMIEGGSEVAAAFLDAGLVDRLLLYRAPVTFGSGIAAFRQPGANGVPPGWTLADRRRLGSDWMEVYQPA
ncbi:bifunctional diaminohydroxyphosphoribosylaminopyrimidine deaminase/5-amino-6-(5-phosphoribosylamino)uracil reductase RibD [Altererythrobacter sp. CC-YST694]|uniref:bifunctional diaminohydroxyphosphoribosylaminopyrimidine deaminase/5-amino-6-(5-phosphoribosylamino)uracil reductase RibD n=1 Tax=Altererythrobacter sp. CC-YST694 TaxID=2755038 RepID=UPI001D021727|nr:bifunctional diaminohydroxyphosphoribosylaminopyrimidine deaminase/5-amino-6-(5-phosphoribosylamino)uracil reductase RibD [Altererythrobacter sp. CC-YST694]MCB5426619.1 bifunctional diaminohydroxyphosphoribosylaminopyrimidine deaminase/5-amino-6-(5-phosphoribosylamino)uracil reductase RibD [Altererythrobacter sp. CC-YST694]